MNYLQQLDISSDVGCGELVLELVVRWTNDKKTPGHTYHVYFRHHFLNIALWSQELVNDFFIFIFLIIYVLKKKIEYLLSPSLKP